MSNRLLSGHYHTLGAHWDGEGVNFALFSAHAEKVELCLFDPSGKNEIARYEMPEHTHDVWHGYLPGLEPGALYGYRVYGPYSPQSGHRFNHHKLLLDPYARLLAGKLRWNDANFGYYRGDKAADLSFDARDNAEFMPKCVVTTTVAIAQDSLSSIIKRRPLIPWHKTSIYETHVRGFTIMHPDVPELQRGTFAGLGHEKIVGYIKSLGITSVELMPVQSFIDEHFLYEKGLKNYWGYNTLSFFAPQNRYMSSTDVAEFRHMVDAFHEAGIEVIMDVVYNHSCESNHLGPTLSFRGIDNASYYRLQAEQPRYYVNDTGCGNTLDISHPRVLQLVMDSLRYWSAEMGVDGFRFDLATVLGRDAKGFNQRSGFMQAIAQDPLLARTKLIAEPWDIGPGGYQLGHFPASWSEWNDDYRDTVRRYWCAEPGLLPTLARRLHGSSDIFERSHRRPTASINYIASHDGFTLRDLVCYQQRHNMANGENNNDGHRENFTENFGIEGDSDDPGIEAARSRQQRNLLATLMVSQGVPMIQAGDELGRSQYGNNNAYCQDNELSWIDWSSLGDKNQALKEFVTLLLKVRSEHPVFCYPNYIHPHLQQDDVDIQWLNCDGQQMRDEHWQEQHNFVLGYLLSDLDTAFSCPHVLVVFNNSKQPQQFKLPVIEPSQDWLWHVDTREPNGVPKIKHLGANESLQLESRSVVILCTGQETE